MLVFAVYTSATAIDADDHRHDRPGGEELNGESQRKKVKKKSPDRFYLVKRHADIMRDDDEDLTFEHPIEDNGQDVRRP